MYAIDWNLVGLIGIPIACVFLTVWVTRWFEQRPKLRHFLEHATGIRVQQPGQPQMIVNTHTIVLRNTGSKTETNVRLGHQPLQFWYQVHPDGLHAERPLAEGGREIIFERLAPGRSVSITYLYFAPTLWSNINTHIEGDTGISRLVRMQAAPIVPRWLQALLWFFLASGIVAWLYLLLVWVR